MTEICYLKRLCYYDSCAKCKGGLENPCYATRKDSEEELQDIHRLYAERLETITDEFDFNNFGMGFKDDRH